MDIVEEIRNDREKGAKRLESEYRSGLMTLAMRICHNSSDAAELVNHTFAEVIANIDKYAEQSAFFGWMSKILVNLHAKEKRRKSVDDIVYPGEVPEIADAEAQEEIYRNLDHSLLRDAIETLPEDIRKTLLLHYFMDMPVKDIARFLAIPSGTVMWRLHYARQMLAAKMGAATEKPGGKAVLLALLLCGLTALGAAVWHLAVPGEAQNPATATNADHATSDKRQADAYGLQFSTSSNLPQSPSGVAGSPQRGAEGGADFSQGENMNITQTTHAAMLAAATIATSAAIPATADTYTWTGTANSLWDTTSQNWTVGGTPASWVDGNDAVIDLPSGADNKIKISGSRTVHNLTSSANARGFFLQEETTGASALTVNGAISPGGNILLQVPLIGNNGLHLSGTSYLYLYKNNTYTGGTYLESTGLHANGGGLLLEGGTLGAVPASPRDDIFVNSSYPTLNVSGNRTLEANRHIRIADGKWFNLGPSGNLTIKGRIHGENVGGLDYPTTTHLYVRGNWNGRVILDPGDSVTNDIGALTVRGLMTLASGVTRVSSSLENKVDSDNGSNNGAGDGNALCFIRNDGASTYDNSHGGLLIAPGAALETPEETWNDMTATSASSRRFHTSRHAQVEVHGRLWMPNVEYMNGFTTPAKLTIGDGGDVCLALLQPTASASPCEINLNAGGTLRLFAFSVQQWSSDYCAINLNGGVIHPRRIVANVTESNFLGTYGTVGTWENIVINVLEGGAVFETTEANAFCNRPLKSGVAAGTADGGLTIRGGNATAFVLSAVGSDYNGPTRVECVEGNTMVFQVRASDALPDGTTVQLGPNAKMAFTDYSGTPYNTFFQTIARAEGCGTFEYNNHLSVTNGVAPVFDGQYGTLTFGQSCSLSGDLEIKGDANGCGSLKFASSGQSIAGLTLKMANPSAFATDISYKIIDAPNGFIGTFAALDLPPAWAVRYADNAVYLRHYEATVISLR